MESLNILLLEDSDYDADLIARVLKKSGKSCDIKRVDKRNEYMEALKLNTEFDVILSDHSMNQFNSIEALQIFKDLELKIPFILVTGSVSEEFAVDILKKGADDYILKDHMTRLPSAIENAIAKKRAEREKLEAVEKLHKAYADLEIQTEKLKSINGELEQYAYIISHDLREPIRMITGFLSLLEKKFDFALDPKARQYVQFAVEGAARLRKLVDDILEYSRIDKVEYHNETVDLNEVIRDVEMIYRKLIIDKNARIKHDPFPVIVINRMLIQRLFQNLVSNALKFNEEDRSVEVNISYRDAGAHHEFSFADNGKGLEGHELENLRRLLGQGDDLNKVRSTGLGLMISRKIVEELGGEIWIESVLGVGTTFHFSARKVS